MPRIANKRDVFAGLTFVAIGLAALVVGYHLKIGTPARMGAGFFPMILTGLLIVLGLVIAASGLRSSEEATPLIAWRPAAAIAGGVALFAALIGTAGLALCVLLVVFVSRLARPGHPWRETILLGLGVSALSAVVFYFGLGVQVPLWPQLG